MCRHFCFPSGRLYGWNWGLRPCSPRVITANRGRFTVIQRQCHYAMKVSWCPTSGGAPKKNSKKSFGVALMALLRGANDPEGWLGCAGASGLVQGTRLTPDLHKEWGEPRPVQWQRIPLCPGEPSWEDSSAALLWGCSRAGCAWQGTELPQIWQPFAGGHVGSTWPKCFPVESHCLIPAAGDCHPARCKLHLPPQFQMLAARQAKLSPTHHLEAAPDECRDCRFVSFEGRGGRQEAHYCLEMKMWPKCMRVQQLEAEDSPRKPRPSQEELFYLQTDTLPWRWLCHHRNPGNPFAPSCKEQGAALTFPPSLLTGVLWEAMPVSHRENSMDSDSSWVRDNMC